MLPIPAESKLIAKGSISMLSAGRFSTKWCDFESTFTLASKLDVNSRPEGSFFFICVLYSWHAQSRNVSAKKKKKKKKKKSRPRVVRAPHAQHASYAPVHAQAPRIAEPKHSPMNRSDRVRGDDVLAKEHCLYERDRRLRCEDEKTSLRLSAMCRLLLFFLRS